MERRRAQMRKEREDFEKAMEEQFQQSNDLIRQFFDDGEMEKFQQNFRQMFRDFQNFEHMDDSIFTTPGMQQFLKRRGSGNRYVQKQWEDGPQADQVTLILKVKQQGDRPLSIKFEKGMLKIQGTIKQERKDAKGRVISTSASTVNIQESLGRDDIYPDPVNMLQDKDGYLRVIFKRKLAQGKKKNPTKRPGAPSRQQLKHDENSPSI